MKESASEGIQGRRKSPPLVGRQADRRRMRYRQADALGLERFPRLDSSGFGRHSSQEEGRSFRMGSVSTAWTVAGDRSL